MPRFAHTLLAICLAGSVTSPVISNGGAAQVTFAVPRDDDPYVLCRAWLINGNTAWATGVVPNVKGRARERFRHHLKQYEKSSGKRFGLSCITSNVTSHSGVFTPGDPIYWDDGSDGIIREFDFLPANWAEIPTPEEVRQQAAEEAAVADLQETDPTAAAERVQAAEDQRRIETEAIERRRVEGLNEAARRRDEALAAEARARQAAYSAQLEQHRRQVENAERAQREHAAALARNRAQQEEYQRKVREHEAEVARIEALYPNSPCARFRRAKGEGWKVNPCV